ncbi:TVP38/TMEM64 family protein [Corynebacterium riegelii]|uniref:TVP38/TMEM64 family protein n=1 Tax=Corynebacterium riegelii TaxID=156976 RepID=UPI00068C7DF5|nr:TVP38/TMEM64 family protein [Corynebacterium riegelii]
MKRRQLLLLAALVVFVLGWLLFDAPTPSTLRSWADSTGAWFPVIFWLLYVGITLFPIPRTILTVSSGLLFGPALGIVIAISATTVAAVITLLVVRYTLRDFVAPRLTHPSVERINARLESRGWLAVASLRMVAFVPFSIMNYACALTRVRVVPFAVATFVGSLPGTIVTVLLGDTLSGHASPTVIALTVALTVVGLVGLLLDANLPQPTRQAPKVDR